ncbi:hypothetical protein B0T24DRAFT_678605 [Lasiosphaeria ovina]|uniref:Uncharacterized protein n=1 Tax=Lasiosphaeria ovina TaxID=92902 RepID=A0AAE0KAM3_9PEZI|nr:hypothetical protein B0T24DRAFT_678605 [Lasiosphaeria ovina]
METIHELNPESPINMMHLYPTPGKPRTPQQTTAEAMPAAFLPSPISPPVPDQDTHTPKPKSNLTRNPSSRVRDWVKGSSSSRQGTSGKTPGAPPASRLEALQIVHLGGRRVGEADYELARSTSTVSAPAERRLQRSRSSSADSRVTQWFDLYQDSVVPFAPMQLQLQPQAQAQAESHPQLPGAPMASRRLQHRPSKSEGLRPAPLRVPSTELKEPGSGSQPSTAALARKNSKWKPLPGVPAQQQQLAAFTAQPQPRQPVIPPYSSSSSSSQLDRPLLPTKALQDSLAHLVRREKDQIMVISTTLGSSSTPPPTPDSDAGGRAAAQPSSSSSSSSSRPAERRKERTPPPRDPRAQQPAAVSAQKLLPHTRSERMWLHENYRGEAPFLSAWGLDIQRPEDRAEGLDILRDLIRSEARGGEVRGRN